MKWKVQRAWRDKFRAGSQKETRSRTIAIGAALDARLARRPGETAQFRMVQLISNFISIGL